MGDVLDLRDTRAGVAIAVLILAAVLSASTAHCQDAPPERPEALDLPELQLRLPDCPGADRIVVMPDGETRMPRSVAECQLVGRRALTVTVPYVRLLEDRLRADDLRIELRDRELDLTERARLAAASARDAALRRAREAEEAADAWFRHPALWFAVGVVVTVLLEVAAVAVLQEVIP